MAKKIINPKDREAILSHVTSDEFQSQLSIETLNSKSNQHLLFIAKWQLFEDQIRYRKFLIEREITFWKRHTPSCKMYLEKTYPMVRPILDIWAECRPITDEMLVDFIAGWAMSRFALLPTKLNKKEQGEMLQLTQPPMEIFKEFLQSKEWHEYILNKCIPETKNIIIKYNSFQEDIVNERDALLFFMQGKKAMPLSKKQIEMLKIEYLKEQNQLVKEYRKITEEVSTEFTKKKVGRKKSEPLPVKNYIRNIDEDHVDLFLNKLKDECQNYSPIEFIYLLNAMSRMGYLFVGNDKMVVFNAFEKFFQKTYGNKSNKWGRWNEAMDADKKGSENPLLPKMLSVVSGLIRRNNILLLD